MHDDGIYLHDYCTGELGQTRCVNQAMKCSHQKYVYGLRTKGARGQIRHLKTFINPFPKEKQKFHPKSIRV